MAEEVFVKNNLLLNLFFRESVQPFPAILKQSKWMEIHHSQIMSMTF